LPGGELNKVGVPATKDPALPKKPLLSPPLRCYWIARIKKHALRVSCAFIALGRQSQHQILLMHNHYGANYLASKLTKKVTIAQFKTIKFTLSDIYSLFFNENILDNYFAKGRKKSPARGLILSDTTAARTGVSRSITTHRAI
jgi:hypothetical protein